MRPVRRQGATVETALVWYKYMRRAARLHRFHLGFSSPLMINHEFLRFSYHDKISAERFPLAGGTFNQQTFISSGLFTSNHLGRADMMDDSGLRHAPKW